MHDLDGVTVDDARWRAGMLEAEGGDAGQRAAYGLGLEYERRRAGVTIAALHLAHPGHPSQMGRRFLSW